MQRNELATFLWDGRKRHLLRAAVQERLSREVVARLVPRRKIRIGISVQMATGSIDPRSASLPWRYERVSGLLVDVLGCRVVVRVAGELGLSLALVDPDVIDLHVSREGEIVELNLMGTSQHRTTLPYIMKSVERAHILELIRKTDIEDGVHWLFGDQALRDLRPRIRAHRVGSRRPCRLAILKVSTTVQELSMSAHIALRRVLRKAGDSRMSR